MTIQMVCTPRNHQSRAWATLVAIQIFLILSSTNAFTTKTVTPKSVKSLSYPNAYPSISRHSRKLYNSNQVDEEREKLLSKAAQLREEVASLESKMTEEKRRIPQTPQAKPLTFSKVSNSTWILTYRFGKDPDEKQTYSGKVGVRFRPDGYTDIVPLDESGNAQFLKFWGWDVEVSNEDELSYLLFSADVFLEDANLQERFYFNARVDTTEAGEVKTITLADGVVTAKREFQPTDGQGKVFWGIFNAGVILAQFRKLGFFSCKPLQVE